MHNRRLQCVQFLVDVKYMRLLYVVIYERGVYPNNLFPVINSVILKDHLLPSLQIWFISSNIFH